MICWSIARKTPAPAGPPQGRWPLPRGVANEVCVWASSTAFPHAQVPLAQQPNLLSRVAFLDHAVDEVLVLLRLVGARLGVEADDGQKLLGVREHLLLDHRAQLLVARPERVLAVVVGASPQHEVDDLVAEVLRV